jgi:hypothetical protein
MIDLNCHGKKVPILELSQSMQVSGNVMQKTATDRVHQTKTFGRKLSRMNQSQSTQLGKSKSDKNLPHSSSPGLGIFRQIWARSTRDLLRVEFVRVTLRLLAFANREPDP